MSSHPLLKTLTLASVVALLGACADPLAEDDWDSGGGPTTDGTSSGTDGGTIGMTCTDPEGDYDSDGILNGDEGCLTGRDSDGDKYPDWQDLDSDDDKVPDNVERGAKSSTGKCLGAPAGKDGWPCDSDGDRLPDYLDKDSDGDGMIDGAEDANGDGLVGCCLAKCNTPGSYEQQKCNLTKSVPAKSTDGCGSGQTCVKGTCTPPVTFKCSEGETSASKKDTFGDGKLDNERGTFICRDAKEDNQVGRKPVSYKQSDAAKGDWHVATEKTAKYGEMKINNPGKKMVAAALDHEQSTEEVAGFLLSMDCTKEKIQDVLTGLIASVGSAGLGTVTQRASGTQIKSHDKYDAVQSTILDIKASSSTNVSTLRNEVVAAFLGKQITDLSNLPQPFGSSDTEFVVKFTTIKRVEFKKDSKGNLVKDTSGYPVDSGDTSKWRTIVIGAVASLSNDQDPKLKTGFIVEDLSNGTGVAIYTDKVGDECDVGTITQLPIADIIWVVDESGSMSDNRQDIVNNANNFFSRALSSGLDFRMGVTNVCTPTGAYKAAVGKFCSQISTSTTDMGGTDRFLLPSEQTIFSSCVNNPPGYEGGSEYGLVNAKEAVKLHLPRASNDQAKIRTNATLVIIVATDELPQSMTSVIGSNYSTCTLASATQTAVDTAVYPYLQLFSGVTDPEAASIFHIIGGVCSNSCGAYVAHGYKELAQKLNGQWADVCQKNLGNTLQVIIDSITGAASPVVLEYVPISASLAVALDAVAVSRSRTNGFDFRPSSNSLVFINVKYKKGSEVIASYKRWEGQTKIN